MNCVCDLVGSVVYACLGVSCHLHFWQNDKGLLRATVVTQGWNGHQIRDSTQNWLWRRNFSRRSCLDSNPQSFDHESVLSHHSLWRSVSPFPVTFCLIIPFDVLSHNSLWRSVSSLPVTFCLTTPSDVLSHHPLWRSVSSLPATFCLTSCDVLSHHFLWRSVSSLPETFCLNTCCDVLSHHSLWRSVSSFPETFCPNTCCDVVVLRWHCAVDRMFKSNYELTNSLITPCDVLVHHSLWRSVSRQTYCAIHHHRWLWHCVTVALK